MEGYVEKCLDVTEKKMKHNFLCDMLWEICAYLK